MDTEGCGGFVVSLLRAIGMSIVSSAIISFSLPPEGSLPPLHGTIVATVLFLPSILFYLISSWAISVLTIGQHKNPESARMNQFSIALIILLPLMAMLFDGHLWFAALIASVMLFILVRFTYERIYWDNI